MARAARFWLDDRVAPARQHLSAVRDRVLASDPAYVRLRTALRGTVGSAVTALALHHVPWIGGTGPALLMGVWVAMIASFAVNDPTPHAQRITLGLVPVVGLAGTALGALLAAHTMASRIVMVALVFGAVAVRRFGPRGFTLGTAAFFPYFFALFFHAKVADLPRITVGIVTGTAIAYALRFHLVPERTERILPGVLQAFRARVATLLLHLAGVVRAERLSVARTKALHDEVAALNRAALDFEGALERVDPACVGGPEAQEALLGRLLDLELASETAAHEIEAGLRTGALASSRRDDVADALLVARAVVRGDVLPHLAHPAASGIAPLDAALAALAASPPSALARGELSPACPPEVVLAAGPPLPATPARFEPLDMHPSTRQAIQASIAGGLAIVAGGLLSSARWYWAVLTAYIVFNRAPTVGASLARAWERVFGTVVGVGAGLLVAQLVKDEPNAQVALVFTCIFVSLYVFRVSYAWFVLGFTLVLAVLYRLLGRYTPGLMLLRLEETLVGSILGAAVAAFVLPARAPVRIRAKAAEVLDALATLLDGVAERAVPQTGRFLDLARAVDRRLQDLRVLHGSGREGRELAALVAGASELALETRRFARAVDRAGVDDAIALRAAALREDATALARRLDAHADDAERLLDDLAASLATLRPA